MPKTSVNGVELDYRVDGPPEGDPVLLVCGTGQPAFSWQLGPMSRLVKAGYRVATFDNRGVSPSEAPPPPYSVIQMAEDAAGMIEHLGIGPCRVAGLSLGAFITQELALARPDLVRAAVMMGTVGRQSPMMRYWAEGSLEAARQGMVLPRRLEAVMMVREVLSPAHQLDEGYVGPMLDLIAQVPPWVGPGREGQLAADAAYENRLTALAGVKVPALVIGFEHDLMTPAYLGREVAESIPGGRYVEVPGCGHMGPFEDLDTTLGHVLAFFAET
jgi:pimeloyl-ACP methyl ester carboxylesterase